MATLKVHTAVSGSGKEPPAKGDAVGEQPQRTPERRLVDALLDISEEDLSKELEPFEYHCYSGWEEAVRGWARADPLSCILLTQKRYKKEKHKEADNPTPRSVDPTIPNADSSSSTAEHRCESHVGRHNSFKKCMPLNQHMGSWNNSAVAALQKDASEWPALHAVQKTMSNLLLDGKTEEGMLSSKLTESRPAKLQKHNHRPSNTVVPIRNFTFLPPIKSPRLNSHRVSGKKVPEGEHIEENCFSFDKKSGTRGTRVNPVANPELPTYSAALASKYHQHNPHLFSAVSVSVSKRYQVPTSSKPDRVQRTSYSVGKSKTVRAVKLYEGCEINV